MKLLAINCPQVRQRLVQFIRDFVRGQSFSKVVIGLSGGLDSSVCAFLAVEALAKENCLGVFLPHSVSHSSNLEDAQKVAAELGLSTRLVEITLMVESFRAAFPAITGLQLGNVMARCRMVVLYQISAEENALVLGTSNKSEILLGYGTLYGDLGCAFDPLGDLYKTQVRQLAEHLDVPEEIRQKIPSADLWEGQSDEEELGVTYTEADRFLIRWIEGRRNREELIAEGFDPEFTDRIIRRVISQQFKRTMPPTPKSAGHSTNSESASIPRTG